MSSGTKGVAINDLLEVESGLIRAALKRERLGNNVVNGGNNICTVSTYKRSSVEYLLGK